MSPREKKDKGLIMDRGVDILGTTLVSQVVIVLQQNM